MRGHSKPGRKRRGGEISLGECRIANAGSEGNAVTAVMKAWMGEIVSVSTGTETS